MVIDKELERGTRVTVRLTSPPPTTGGKKSKSTFSVFVYWCKLTENSGFKGYLLQLVS